MSTNDPLDRWIEQEAGRGVPEGFAERVMAAAREPAARPGWWQRPALRAAAWAAASLLAAARAAAALLVYLGG